MNSKTSFFIGEQNAQSANTPKRQIICLGLLVGGVLVMAFANHCFVFAFVGLVMLIIAEFVYPKMPSKEERSNFDHYLSPETFAEESVRQRCLSIEESRLFKLTVDLGRFYIKSTQDTLLTKWATTQSIVSLVAGLVTFCFFLILIVNFGSREHPLVLLLSNGFLSIMIFIFVLFGQIFVRRGLFCILYGKRVDDIYPEWSNSVEELVKKVKVKLTLLDFMPQSHSADGFTILPRVKISRDVDFIYPSDVQYLINFKKKRSMVRSAMISANVNHVNAGKNYEEDFLFAYFVLVVNTQELQKTSLEPKIRQCAGKGMDLVFSCEVKKDEENTIFVFIKSDYAKSSSPKYWTNENDIRSLFLLIENVSDVLAFSR